MPAEMPPSGWIVTSLDIFVLLRIVRSTISVVDCGWVKASFWPFRSEIL